MGLGQCPGTALEPVSPRSTKRQQIAISKHILNGAIPKATKFLREENYPASWTSEDFFNLPQPSISYAPTISS